MEKGMERPSQGLNLDDTFLFTHGLFPVDYYGIRIVNDAVKDGVCQWAFAEFTVPAFRPELGREDCRAFFMP